MPYFPNINSYLHQSSLLVQAYPGTTRVTTKYSLPRRRKAKPVSDISNTESLVSTDATSKKPAHDRPPPTATLTFKTFETTAGICLKYETNKAAEVGRLMTGLGRLAKGEIIEETSATATEPETKDVRVDDRMDIDALEQKVEKVADTASGGGKAKKKKGKK